MLDEKLQHQLYEIIAIDKGLLEQDETRVELWERLSELRDDVSATIDKRYGDLFRLLVAADMIDFDYFEGENGYFSLSPSSYLGPYNGNSLSFVKDGEGASAMSGRFCEVFSDEESDAKLQQNGGMTNATND